MKSQPNILLKNEMKLRTDASQKSFFPKQSMRNLPRVTTQTPIRSVIDDEVEHSDA
jgi:hypothetical protein